MKELRELLEKAIIHQEDRDDMTLFHRKNNKTEVIFDLKYLKELLAKIIDQLEKKQ